jgi:hypothetical protein
MITKIRVDGFRSLNNFCMGFPYSTTSNDMSQLRSLYLHLRDLNDVLELLGRFAEGDSFKKAFNETDYDSGDVRIVVDMEVNRMVTDVWGGKFELTETLFRYEVVIKQYAVDFVRNLFLYSESLCTIPINDRKAIAYLYTDLCGVKPVVVAPSYSKGKRDLKITLTEATKSVLSSFNTIEHPHILAVKNEFLGLRTEVNL